MARTISRQEAKTFFDELTASLSATREAVIIEDGGKPVMVVITPEDYERLRQADERARLWVAIEAVGRRNADLDPDEVLRDVTETVDAVRQELHEERQLAAQRGG